VRLSPLLVSCSLYLGCRWSLVSGAEFLFLRGARIFEDTIHGGLPRSGLGVCCQLAVLMSVISVAVTAMVATITFLCPFIEFVLSVMRR